MAASVRLLPGVEQSLVSYCAQAGVSKSHVLQEALAQYLMHPARSELHSPDHSVQDAGSEVFQAFTAASLIGQCSGRALSVGAHSADKTAVRAAARRRLQPAG